MIYLIGQRVIYSRVQIVTVVSPHGREQDPGRQWVETVNGIQLCVALDNLKPLPNGQM